jgi:hypothetical protein
MTPHRHNLLFMRLSSHFVTATKTFCGGAKNAAAPLFMRLVAVWRSIEYWWGERQGEKLPLFRRTTGVCGGIHLPIKNT